MCIRDRGEPALEIEDKADENLPEIEADEAEEVPEDSLEEK